jgi:hypothetical protein
VHSLDLKGELAPQNNIIEELIPPGARCEFRSRKSREGMEVEPIKYKTKEIQNPKENKSRESCDQRSSEAQVHHGKDRKIHGAQKLKRFFFFFGEKT